MPNVKTILTLSNIVISSITYGRHKSINSVREKMAPYRSSSNIDRVFEELNTLHHQPASTSRNINFQVKNANEFFLTNKTVLLKSTEEHIDKHFKIKNANF